MTTVINLEHVTKSYGGSRGVKDVSFKVDQGAVFGFLGPNGAGKTTTISMLVDLIRPTSGAVNIFGLEAQRNGLEIRRRIGFLAGDFALDERLTGWQQLEYFGNLRGGVTKNRIQALATRLESDLSRQIKTLSRGNRQKIGLISALMHDPELLIFDEPTSGLDPLIQAEFNKIILEHKQQGKTTFISSHMLSEVQILCDDLAFIRDGELIAVKTAQELAVSSTKHIHVLSDDKSLMQLLAKQAGVKVLKHGTGSITFTISRDINPILRLLARHKIRDVTITEADLEATFMAYYERGVIDV